MPQLVNLAVAQIRAYTQLAIAYSFENNHQESLYWTSEADKRLDAVLYIANHWLYGQFINADFDIFYGKAMNLLFMASSELQIDVKNKENADRKFNKAIKYFKNIHYKHGIALALSIKAKTYYDVGLYTGALFHAEKALNFIKENKFIDFIWRIESIKGEALKAMNKFQESEQAFRDAQKSINLLSNSFSDDANRLKFKSKKSSVFYNLIQFDIKNKNYTQLYRDLENANSIQYISTLNSQLINNTSENLNMIKKLDQRIVQEKSELNSVSDKLYSGNITSLIKEREKYVDKLKIENPNIASTVSVNSNSLKQVRDSLGNSDAILYFLPTRKKEEKVSYFLISKNTIKIKKLQVSSNELVQRIKYLSNKGKNQKSLQDVVDQFTSELELSALRNYKKVYVVPYGNVYFIPWGIFNTNFIVSIIPSSSWLNFDNKSTTKKITIVANPSFGGLLSQLPKAEEEAIVIKNQFDDVNFLINSDATISKLRKSIGNGTHILHLATHASFSKYKPLDSALYLTDGKLPKKLTVKDLYRNPIKADLVVMSACESALGKVQGNEYIGLNRSFFANGTKLILGSLWKVDDKLTKEFMETFYRFSKENGYFNSYKKTVDLFKKKGYPASIYSAFVLSGTELN